jgi:hypothetical protein
MRLLQSYRSRSTNMSCVLQPHVQQREKDSQSHRTESACARVSELSRPGDLCISTPSVQRARIKLLALVCTEWIVRSGFVLPLGFASSWEPLPPHFARPQVRAPSPRSLCVRVPQDSARAPPAHCPSHVALVCACSVLPLRRSLRFASAFALFLLRDALAATKRFLCSVKFPQRTFRT